MSVNKNQYMTKNIVHSEVLDSLEIVIRYPQEGDANAMCDYINKLSKEKTYITWQGEKIKLEDEEKYLKEQIERIKSKETVQLLLFVNNKLSGISSIDLRKRVNGHNGTFGISIAKDQRGKGLGKLLMKLVLDEAVKNISKLKIITLEVFAENMNAIKMYSKFGFKEYGRLPKGIKYKNRYIDEILLYKMV